MNLPTILSNENDVAIYQSYDCFRKEGLALFNSNRINKDGVHESIFCDLFEFLRKSGIPKKHFTAGALVQFAFISPKLGEPLSLAIKSEEGEGVPNLINCCVNITPSECITKIDDNLINKISKGNWEDYLNRKTLYRTDFIITKKYRDFIDQVMKIYMPAKQISSPMINSISLAIVSVISDNNDPTLNHPLVLKIKLPADSTDIDNHYDIYDQIDYKIGCEQLKIFFEMIDRSYVEIPFKKQLQMLTVDKDLCNKELFGLILKVIRITTRINNLRKLSKKEALYYLLRLNKDLEKYTQRGLVPSDNKTLTSTLIDYYYGRLILKDLVLTDSKKLSKNQLVVFNATKDHNIEWMKGRAFVDIDRMIEEDILDLLWKSKYAWADRFDISKRIKADTGIRIEDFKIIELIQELSKLGIIDVGKSERSNNLAYAVRTLSVNIKLQLPHPSELKDSDEPIKVMNPFTGDIEEI